MNIVFVAGFAPISTDPQAASSFYRDALGLPLETVSGDYIAMDGFEGVKHLGVWPLAAAADSCFGQPTWPDDIPVPQGTIEFELADADAVAAAVDELEAAGHRFIHGVRTEPWGQTIARLLGPEGLLVGLCFTPWLHENAGVDADAEPGTA